VNFEHKFNNLKSSYHFLKNFLARCARSIAFYNRQKRKHAMCFTNSIYIFFCFGGSLSLTSDLLLWKISNRSLSLTDSFQNSLKTRTNCTKLRVQCPKIVCREGVEEGTKGGDVRMGGRAPWLLEAGASTPLKHGRSLRP